MSGEIDVTTGYLFDEDSGEVITLTKLNDMIRDMILRIQAGAVAAREIADGTITADKLDAAIAAQLGIPNGSITTAKLADNCLEDSATGRGKMEDGFLSADAAGRAKMDNGFVDTDQLADGCLSADAAGRAKMEDAFITAAKIGLLPMFHVHKNGTDQQNLVRLGWRDVSWGTEAYDTEPAFAAGAHTIVTPGYYQYGAQLSWVKPSHDWDNYAAAVGVAVDGVIVHYAFIHFGVDQNQHAVSVLTPPLNLAAGKVVTVKAYHTMEDTPGTHGDIDGDAAHTWFWGKFICGAA